MSRGKRKQWTSQQPGKPKWFSDEDSGLTRNVTIHCCFHHIFSIKNNSRHKKWLLEIISLHGGISVRRNLNNLYDVIKLNNYTVKKKNKCEKIATAIIIRLCK